MVQCHLSAKISELFGILSAFIICLPLMVSSVSAGDSVPLSLSDALDASMNSNRTLEIKKSLLKQRKFEIKEESGKFEPEFELSSTIDNERRGTVNRDNRFRLENRDYQAGLKKLLKDGDKISVSVESKGEESRSFLTRNRQEDYQSSINVRYILPLFEDAGGDVNLADVRRAEIRKRLAAQKNDDQQAQVLFNVYRDYFDLYEVLRELDIQREILTFTERIRNVVQEKVDKRTLPINALTQIKAALLRQKNRIEDLKNSVRVKQYELMLSIYDRPQVEEAIKIHPTTSPDFVSDQVSVTSRRSTIQKAKTNDIELIELIKQKRILLERELEAENKLYPDVTLTSEAGFDGYDLNRRSDSIDDISDDNYHVLFQGTISFPWDEKTARNRLRSIEQEIQQYRHRIANRTNEIKKTVTELFDDIETTRKQLNQSSKISDLSEKNLNQEIERLVAGKSTVLDTLQFQRDYSEARLDELGERIRLIQLKGMNYLFRRDMRTLFKRLRGARTPDQDTLSDTGRVTQVGN